MPSLAPPLIALLRHRRPQTRHRHHLRPGRRHPGLTAPHPPLRPGGLRVPRALHLDHEHHRGHRLHALRNGDHAPEDRRGGRKPAGPLPPLRGGNQAG